MTLSVAIMHHPAREIVAEIDGATVVTDEGFGVWHTARRAWAAYDPECEWHLVLQDDVLLAPDFEAGFRRALSAAPIVSVVSAFGVSKRIKLAAEDGFSWLVDTGIAWGQALAIPTRLIPPMLAWIDSNVRPEYKHDDARVSLWCLDNGVPVWFTIPCLVEHVGWERSLAGNPSKLGGRPRMAALFHKHRSALSYRWDQGIKCVYTKKIEHYYGWRREA